jgi:hypothetical protein
MDSYKQSLKSRQKRKIDIVVLLDMASDRGDVTVEWIIVYSQRLTIPTSRRRQIGLSIGIRCWFNNWNTLRI